MSLLHFIELGHALEHAHQQREQQRAEAEQEVLKRNMESWEQEVEGEEFEPVDGIMQHIRHNLNPTQQPETLQLETLPKPDRQTAAADLQHKHAKDAVGYAEN